jgi:inorganic pyrophosphatase
MFTPSLKSLAEALVSWTSIRSCACSRSQSLMAGLAYPYDWGFIPSTKAEDGDPLDVLVILDAQTYPGVVLRCKSIEILEVEQA